MAEIGIRKAFGAKRHVILIQVLYENLITTLIGGVIGLDSLTGSFSECANGCSASRPTAAFR